MLTLVVGCAAPAGLAAPAGPPAPTPVATGVATAGAEVPLPPKGTNFPGPLYTPSLPSATADPSSLNIVLQRSGGFTGRTEAFVLKSDGTVTMAVGNMHVPGGTAAAQQLARNLVATNILSVPPGDYLPSNVCCDRYLFELTLALDGKTYHYVTLEGTDSTPPSLRETIALIEDYITSAR